MHDCPVALALQFLQQPPNMPFALPDLLGSLPLRDQPLLCLFQCDQPVAVPLRHEKCSCFHLSTLTSSIGHFYLALLGLSHLAATLRKSGLPERRDFDYDKRARI